jgi:hypothetical protein
VVIRKHSAEPFVSLPGRHMMHVCAAKAQLLHSMPVQGSLHWHLSSPCARLQYCVQRPLIACPISVFQIPGVILLYESGVLEEDGRLRRSTGTWGCSNSCSSLLRNSHAGWSLSAHSRCRVVHRSCAQPCLRVWITHRNCRADSIVAKPCTALFEGVDHPQELSC